MYFRIDVHFLATFDKQKYLYLEVNFKQSLNLNHLMKMIHFIFFSKIHFTTVQTT